MNRNRLPMIIVIVFLAASAAVAIQTVVSNSSVQASGRQNVTGMGDLRHLEGQQANSINAGSRQNVTGMGDLRYLEAQQAGYMDAGAQASSRVRAPGFGDLRRFEGQQIIPYTGGLRASGSGSTHAPGFGDLHRFEAEPGGPKLHQPGQYRFKPISRRLPQANARKLSTETVLEIPLKTE